MQMARKTNIFCNFGELFIQYRRAYGPDQAQTKAKWKNIVYEKGLYYLGHSLMQFGDYGAEYRSAAESLPLEGGS